MASDVAEICSILNERTQVLELLTDQSRTQQQVYEQTEASQSTVSRTLTQLQNLGLVSRCDDRYALTFLGKLCYNRYREFTSEVDQYYDAAELLEELPAETSMDPALLDGAEITTSEPHAPDAALSPLLKLTHRATEIKAAAAAFHTGYVKTFEQRMKESDLESEFIMTDAVIDRAQAEAQTPNKEPLQTDRLELYRTDSDLPYSLLLVRTEDDVVYTAVLICTESGTHGTIVNSNTVAQEWAQDRYEQIKSNATRLDSSPESPTII